MRKTTILLISISLVLLSGCETTPTRATKSGVQLQSYQAKEFETNKRAAFSATMSVFQDMGFIIDDGEFDTGLITASGPTGSAKMPGLLEYLFSTQQLPTTTRRRATAFVETMPSGLVRIRLNFVDVTAFGANSPQTSLPIEEPVLYQDTFAQIDKAIFVRHATR